MTDQLTSYDPFAPAVQADPYPFYAALRRDAPVHHVESLDAYAVSRHADVRRVLHDHETYSSEAMAELVSRPVEIGRERGGLDQPTEGSISIVGLDGDDHMRLRTIVNRGFTPRRISLLEQQMRALARPFVDALCAAEAGDLMAGFAVPFPTTVIAEMLGVDPDRREDFRRWSEQMVLAVFEPMTDEQRRAVALCGEQMGEYFDEVVAARTGSQGGDVVSVLLRAELEGGALTREEVSVFVFTLLVAGSITTAYLIGNAAMTLAEHPRLLAAVRDDLDLVGAVVEESLRHEAPAQMMFRTTTVDVNVAGTLIPEGATVLPLLGSANRDERVFSAPDCFDINRGASEHLSFGHGIHHCLGAALARLEARVALEELLTRAVRLEPAGAIERVTSLVFRGPTELPLRLA